MEEEQPKAINFKPPRCWFCKKHIPEIIVGKDDFRKRRYDAKYCNKDCRKAWHQEACRIGQNILRKQTEAELAQLD